VPTWMIVEDTPDLFDVLTAMFEIWGIKGAAFDDAPEAMTWIDEIEAGKFQGELPDLAILDLRLPNGSGAAIGMRLRQSKYLHNMGIVLITAWKLPVEREALTLRQTGADALVYKPLPRMEEFRTLLDQIITEHRSGHIGRQRVIHNDRPPAFVTDELDIPTDT
jgi:CheY-like chemotaxis protein